MGKRLIAVNEIGRRVGDSHHNARLTNGEVELILQMHEGTDGSIGLGYKRLAAKFECSVSHVRNIIKGRCRGHRAVAWRRVDDDPPPVG